MLEGVRLDRENGLGQAITPRHALEQAVGSYSESAAARTRKQNLPALTCRSS
jgi:hypothetical protein